MPCTSNRAPCSRSPTAAAPSTPRSWAWRTPCGPSGTPSSSATTTSRPTSTSPATACCSPSTTPSSTGSPTPAAPSPTSTYAEVQRALINGSDPVPTLADLFDEFPEVRFNIDVKSPGAVEPLARFLEEREAWDRVCVGSFSGRRLRRFRRLTGGRVATSASPGEVAAYRLLPASVARLVTRGRPRVLQVPHKRGRLTIVTPGLVRRAHRGGRARARLDHRRPRRDEGAAGPWCRWPDDRPDGHTQGGADRERPMEDTPMTTGAGPEPIADLAAAVAVEGPEGLVLVRLGELRLLHDRALRPLRAVHDHRRRRGGRLRRPRRHVQQDGQPARPRPRRRFAALLPDQLRHHRQCVRAAHRRRVRRPVAPQEVAHGRATPGPARSSAPCCSSCRARAGRSAPSRIVLASILGGCSLVSYYAILCDISTEDERDHVSSRGWAFGYLGGGLLLALNLAVVPRPRHVRARRGDGRAALAAVGGRLVGRLHDHPDGAAAQLRPAEPGGGRGHALPAQLRPALHHAEGDARRSR